MPTAGDSKKRKGGPEQTHPFFASVSKKAKHAGQSSSSTSEAAAISSGSSNTTALADANGNSIADATAPAPDLQSLLDFSGLEDRSEIMARFDHIAKALLHDYLLVVNRGPDGAKTSFQIMELEFYLQKAGCHEDPFTHGSEEQKICRNWYFHRAPRFSADSTRSLTSTAMYRSGSRKGLDLTIGRPAPSPKSVSESESEADNNVKADSESLLRGGVLLRSIRVLGQNSRVVSGPSLLVDQILSASGVAEIPELVEGKWMGDTAAFPQSPPLSSDSTGSDSSNPSVKESRCSLHLVPKPPSKFGSSPTIYSSPRIGLDLSHPGTTGPKVKPLHSRIQFLPRKYRYFVCPHELVANGRYQTFVGVLLHCHAAYSDPDTAYKSAKLLSDVCRITGLKEATAKKYLEEYKSGRVGGERALASFVGPQGKGASSSPSTYLRMMGAISTLDCL